MHRSDPSRTLLFGAFGIVYVVWGSTYLAIRIAIETIPPLLMAGTRFLVAGAILYAWARARGAPRPGARAMRDAALLGALFLFIGNGGLVWAETRVPSGLAAVLAATTPFWTVLIERLRGSQAAVRPAVYAGLALGLIGVVLLMLPGGHEEAVDLLGAGVILVAALVWAYAMVMTRSLTLPESGAVSAAVQMLAGGVLLIAAGSLGGEWSGFVPSGASLRSLLGLGYLIVFGSLVAYSAFTWLLRVAPAGRVSTYAYVNPVVAVLLGWLLASEPFGGRELAASAVIIAGVVLIISGRTRSPGTRSH
ncbi:MAG TPA: drug/metabolite exporter YedA [Gemmatimonadales bacterium]|jgi:drug/metabolite transporter (DMT)-like permease|nr:drug/metabolite exporter YedA [Gemmatimonadales bacterium]